MKKYQKSDLYELMPHDTPEEVASAIKAYFKAEKIHLKTVAIEIGISAQLLSYHLNGKNYPSPEFAARLAARYPNLDEHYIWNGRGELYTPDDIERYSAYLEELSPNFNYNKPGCSEYENGLRKINKEMISRNFSDILESLFGNYNALLQNQTKINDLVKENDVYFENIRKIFEFIQS